MSTDFKFLNLDQLPEFNNALIGRIPRGVCDSKMLLKTIADVLSFPSYFGENWNALSDCLRDFHWTDKRSIVLVHDDLPQISGDELRIYLEVLKEAVADWKAGEAHEFVVVFDNGSSNAVNDALKG